MSEEEEVKKLVEELLHDKLFYPDALVLDEDSRFTWALSEVADEFEDGFVTDVYTPWPDGRGGQLPAIFFKHEGKYYCAEIFDEKTIRVIEIPPDVYYETRADVLGKLDSIVEEIFSLFSNFNLIKVDKEKIREVLDRAIYAVPYELHIFAGEPHKGVGITCLKKEKIIRIEAMFAYSCAENEEPLIETIPLHEISLR